MCRLRRKGCRVCGNLRLPEQTVLFVRGLRVDLATLLGSLLGRAFSPLVTTLDPDLRGGRSEACGGMLAIHRGVHRGTGPAVPTGPVRPLVVVPGEFVDAERWCASRRRRTRSWTGFRGSMVEAVAH